MEMFGPGVRERERQREREVVHNHTDSRFNAIACRKASDWRVRVRPRNEVENIGIDYALTPLHKIVTPPKKLILCNRTYYTYEYTNRKKGLCNLIHANSHTAVAHTHTHAYAVEKVHPLPRQCLCTQTSAGAREPVRKTKGSREEMVICTWKECGRERS